MKKFILFLKEIIKGKDIARALLFSNLKLIIDNKYELNKRLNVLEIGYEPASHERAYPKIWKLNKSNYIKMNNVDYVINANKKFPVNDKEFDVVVFFNVITIIENYDNCIYESIRTAKKFIIFNAPLISGIAKHPNDFNRFTLDRLLKILNNLKKQSKIENYRIHKFGGSFSSSLSLINPYLKYRLIKIPLYLLSIYLDKLDSFIERECPMQYIVLINKK